MNRRTRVPNNNISTGEWERKEEALCWIGSSSSFLLLWLLRIAGEAQRSGWLRSKRSPWTWIYISMLAWIPRRRIRFVYRGTFMFYGLARVYLVLFSQHVICQFKIIWMISRLIHFNNSVKLYMFFCFFLCNWYFIALRYLLYFCFCFFVDFFAVGA